MSHQKLEENRPPSMPRLAGRSRSSLFAAWAVIVGLGVLFASTGVSCRAVVAGGGTDAVTDLCSLLKRCYGDEVIDCSAVRSHFGQAAPDDRFLTFLSQNDCLASCKNAKKCWDFAPVCGAEAAACSASEKCCGFTSGRALCEDVNEPCDTGVCTASRCCTPKSVRCEERSSTCCGGLQCIPGPDGSPTCGGFPACVEISDDCEYDVDCCSKLCTNKKCVQKTCGTLGEGCDSAPGSCCPVPGGSSVACVDGTCQASACVIEPCGAPIGCDPNGDPATSCCGDDSLRCVTDVGGTYSICVHKDQATNKDLLPDGFDCSLPSDCCDTDPTRPRGCVALGVNQCAPLPTCGLVGSTCGDGVDCCSGQCVNAVCTCGGTTCHSPYQQGAPIACGANDPSFSCSSNHVCLVDPYCCCSGWDDICVKEAVLLCGPNPG